MTFLEPLRSILIPFLGFDALVSLVLAVLMAGVILQNRRKNQSIATDIENLIRRYIVFRGHRQALMKFQIPNVKSQINSNDQNPKLGTWNFRIVGRLIEPFRI